jgi:hypothetical protein
MAEENLLESISKSGDEWKKTFAKYRPIVANYYGIEEDLVILNHYIGWLLETTDRLNKPYKNTVR